MLGINKWREHVYNTQFNLLLFKCINFWETLYYVTVRVDTLICLYEKKSILCGKFIRLHLQRHLSKFCLQSSLHLHWKLLFCVTHVKTIGTGHFWTQICLLMCISPFLVFLNLLTSTDFILKRKVKGGTKSRHALLFRLPLI